MKTVPTALRTHSAGGATTLAFGLKVTRRDGYVLAFTSADRDVTSAALGQAAGVTYLAAPGLDIASLVSSSGLAVDNTELTLLADGIHVELADILSGRWDAAEFVLFQYNWSAPGDGTIPVKTGTLGNLQPKRGSHTAEMRGLRQALQQSVGAVLQPTCRYRLGSTSMPAGLCKKDLTSFTVVGTVTSVASAYAFSDSGRTEADDWFTEGMLTWVTGANTGLDFKVRASTLAGAITLATPVVQDIQVGDTYSMVAGCRLRLIEDCKTKFNNVLNFGGEPHVPGQDKLTAPADFAT